MALGADEQHAPVRARADEGVGDLQAGEEPRALHPDVQSACVVERPSLAASRPPLPGK